MSELAARRFHLGVGLLLTLLLVGLQVESYRHAGPLWRDEVNSFNLASMPSYADTLANRHLDSFPMVWPTLLHTWIASVGPTDGAVRGLGLLVGLAMLAALWWSGRRLGLDAPLVTLLLFGLSPSTIVYGDSVRGYGLGALAVALAMGAIWAFVARPAPRTFVVALLAALLAMQTYFPNGVLLFAIFAAAGAVCLRRRAWRTLMAAVAIAALAAASLLFDVFWIVYAFGVGELEQGSYSFGWLFSVFRQALASDVPFLAICWAAAGVLAAIGCALTWFSSVRPPTAQAELVEASFQRKSTVLREGEAPAEPCLNGPGGSTGALRRRSGQASPSPGQQDLALFVSVTAGVALASYFAYLKYIAQLPTQFWYYLSLMAPLALACDVGIHLLARRVRGGEWVRAAAVAVAALLVVRDVAAAVRVRMTNLDLVAQTVAQDAGPDDLIVVFPWVCGITFERYYRGTTPWITVPDFAEHRFHLHGLVKEKMQLGDAGFAAELERVERTLRDGRRVWVVGPLVAPPPGEPAPRLPPAPSGPRGWKAAPYLDGWEQQLGALVQSHGRDVLRISLPDPGPVNNWERLPLILVDGWR